MINKRFVSYIIIAIVTYLVVYRFFDLKLFSVGQKDILKLNTHLIDDKLTLISYGQDYDDIWLKRAHKPHKQKTKGDIYIKKKNVICVDTQCFRLLAIVQKNGMNYATFYANSFPKNHIKLMEPNMNLNNKVFIKDITDNSLVLSEYNTTKQWKLFFFDVNATKYKPKDNNATYL